MLRSLGSGALQGRGAQQHEPQQQGPLPRLPWKKVKFTGDSWEIHGKGTVRAEAQHGELRATQALGCVQDSVHKPC